MVHSLSTESGGSSFHTALYHPTSIGRVSVVEVEGDIDGSIDYCIVVGDCTAPGEAGTHIQ